MSASKLCGWGLHKWRTLRIWTTRTPQIPGHGPSNYYHKTEQCKRCGLKQDKGSSRKFRRVKP